MQLPKSVRTGRPCLSASIYGTGTKNGKTLFATFGGLPGAKCREGRIEREELGGPSGPSFFCQMILHATDLRVTRRFGIAPL